MKTTNQMIFATLKTKADKDARSAENRVNVVAEISRALKIMAKDLNVPVICLSHLGWGDEDDHDKEAVYEEEFPEAASEEKEE